MLQDPISLRGHVLVVDDLRANRLLVVHRLQVEGLRVTEASDGREALRLLADQRFDLVILDVMMPGIDGLEVLRRIRANPAHADLPVLMLSANDELASVVRCIELGAEDYLPKPFEPVLMRARVKACLEKKRYRDAEKEILRRLVLEQGRSERLLLNVLPREIAARLKDNDATIADNFNNVTILFADIVGFTELSTRLAPAALVAMLDEIFTRFDALAERHGLEKIKTIGDAYMVAGGIPIARADHATAIAEMALDMMELMQGAAGIQPGLNIRIGINTGPVVAGVIGKKKFIYDLWGDAVNMASRMESQGLPGRIQVTDEVHALLSAEYEFEDRGTLEVKGKGPTRTHWLLARRQSEQASTFGLVAAR